MGEIRFGLPFQGTVVLANAKIVCISVWLVCLCVRYTNVYACPIYVGAHICAGIIHIYVCIYVGWRITTGVFLSGSSSYRRLGESLPNTELAYTVSLGKSLSYESPAFAAITGGPLCPLFIYTDARDLKYGLYAYTEKKHCLLRHCPVSILYILK